MDIPRAPRVLVVEDDEATAALFRSVLIRHGVSSVTAGDGVSALELLRTNDFDAVILDLLLPLMNGFEVLETLGRTSPLLIRRVVVCTALSPVLLAGRGEVKRVAAVLTKPVDIGTLAGAVLEVVNGASARPRPLSALPPVH